jgi:beta-phosphoglucomutase
MTCHRTVSAVIWDMDGVLVDTFPFHYRAWAEICRGWGRQLTIEEFRAVFGIVNKLVVPRLLGVDPAEEEVIARIGEEKETLFRDLVRGHAVPMPGVVDWLEALRALGIPCAVATSAPRANLDTLLEAARLWSHFEALVCAEDAPRGKPAPDLFLEAARRLSAVPEQCLVVEDSVVGVQAALAAGMRCLAITSHRTAGDLALADHITDNLAVLAPETVLQTTGC